MGGGLNVKGEGGGRKAEGGRGRKGGGGRATGHKGWDVRAEGERGEGEVQYRF